MKTGWSLLVLFLCGVFFGCGSDSESKFDFRNETGTANSPPVALVEANRQGQIGSPIVLDGSGSHDPDGAPLTFRWTIDSRPAGSRTTLPEPAAVRPIFQADTAGEFRFSLIVDDGFQQSAPCPVVIVIVPVGDFGGPVAEAGANRTVTSGIPATLDGSLSFGKNGPLAFAWAILSQPDGSNVQISAAETVNPSFIPLIPGDYEILLTVRDQEDQFARDIVVITAVSPTANSNPIAVVGPDRLVQTGTLVTLDGSRSFDPEGQPFAFIWQISARPAGSLTILSQESTAMPFFIPDLPGDYRLTLIVRDLRGESGSASLVVRAVNGELMPQPLAAAQTANEWRE